MVDVVGAPAGTITHATRGGSSLPTISSSVAAVSAPWAATAVRASADRSNATT